MVQQGMVPAVWGLLAGVFGAVVVTRLLASLLFDTSPTDVPTFSAVAVGFSFVSFVASYLPARRAASVSPVVALRAE
jgi:ABC-type lipoprotein release transport system permease subunit